VGLPDGDSSPHRPPSRGVLLYGMYDISRADQAPAVRIGLMAEALRRLGPTEVITGGRGRRFLRAVRWLASGGPRRVAGVYVESATSSSMPTDLAFLALMRLLGRPVGVFFRDAYQFYRDIYPRRRRRQILTDVLWRITTPMLKAVATVRFVPAPGYAAALRIAQPVFLPPGTEAAAPALGAGRDPLVAYVGNTNAADGFSILLEAMASVRETVPDARLRIVSRSISAEQAAGLPDWVEVTQGDRARLPELLRDARVCVIPRPINAYNTIAAPVKLWDYLSFGKPVVATSPTGGDVAIEESGAGLLVEGTVTGIAEGLRSVLADRKLAEEMAARATAYARSPRATWDARARTVLEALDLPVTAPGGAVDD
jgi:glycosyltransferase involved in cell wall biosynthesis